MLQLFWHRGFVLAKKTTVKYLAQKRPYDKYKVIGCFLSRGFGRFAENHNDVLLPATLMLPRLFGTRLDKVPLTIRR